MFRIEMMLKIKMKYTWLLNAHLLLNSPAPFYADLISCLLSLWGHILHRSQQINVTSHSPMLTPPSPLLGETFHSVIQGTISTFVFRIRKEAKRKY